MSYRRERPARPRPGIRGCRRARAAGWHDALHRPAGQAVRARPRTSAQTASCSAGSRTTPPLPTCPLPTSNCGLISATSRGLRPRQRQRRRQHQPQRDEARIADDEIDRLGNLGRRQVPRIGPLEHDDPRVGAQPRVELPVADVDGMHPRGAAAQQDVGEPAGRCTDVETDEPGGIDREGVQPGDQLVRAARDMIVRDARTSTSRSTATCTPGLSSRCSPVNTRPARISACALVRDVGETRGRPAAGRAGPCRGGRCGLGRAFLSIGTARAERAREAHRGRRRDHDRAAVSGRLDPAQLERAPAQGRPEPPARCGRRSLQSRQVRHSGRPPAVDPRSIPSIGAGTATFVGQRRRTIARVRNETWPRSHRLSASADAEPPGRDDRSRSGRTRSASSRGPVGRCRSGPAAATADSASSACATRGEASRW